MTEVKQDLQEKNTQNTQNGSCRKVVDWDGLENEINTILVKSYPGTTMSLVEKDKKAMKKIIELFKKYV